MIDFACRQFDLDEVIKCSLALSKADFKVLRHLISCKQWQSSDELSAALSLNRSTAQRSLKYVYDKNLIERRQENLEGGGYVFWYKTLPRTVLRKEVMRIIHAWIEKVDSGLEKW